MLELLVASVMGLWATYIFITRTVVKMFPSWGIVGVDVHKPSKPSIPEMGGTALLVGISCFVVVAILLDALTYELLAIFLTMMIAGAIGIADDIFKLNKRVKPVLCMLAGLPIVLMGTYPKDLVLPFSISFHIPTVYALLIPIALAVTTNSINMFDVMNGVASGTSSVVLVALVLSWFVKFILTGGSGMVSIIDGALMILPPIALLFFYNRYPSKIFLGDTGTLSMGAAIGAVAIVYGMEFPAVVAMMVPITNAFFSIFSHGGLFERSELKERPILIGEDGKLSSNPDPKAPLTLTRLMLLLGYDNEKDLFTGFMWLTLAMALVAIACAVLVWGVIL
jgi:UDP-N-acetylmuramyl pentapeptide phosphotransferase/UDP-N-acetylglucosamine-1-phosphate transferase